LTTQLQLSYTRSTVNTPDETAPPPTQFQTQLSSVIPHVGEVPVRQESDPNNPRWGLWQALLTWFLSVVLLFLIPIVFSLPYIIYRYGGNVPNRDVLLHDKGLLFINVVSIIPVHALTFLLAWAVVTQLGKINFRDSIGWSWPINFGFWKSAGLAILLFGIGLALIVLFGGQETDIERLIQSSRATAVTLAFLAFATAPLVEETIYRGVLYPALQRTIGMTGAVVLVSGLFAVGHVYQYWPNVGVISAIVLLSVSLTLVRARTGRLLPCFVIHLIFNGIQSIEILLAPYIPALNSGGEHKAGFVIGFVRALWFF
jgi:membrane protease YdiL (CAAX protease family)